MLSVKKIRKSYGTRRLLHDASFALALGQRMAIVGENGTGKSTLLKIIAGLEPADRGEVVIAQDRLVGYLPQETLVAGRESALEFLRRESGVTGIEESMTLLEKDIADPTVLARYEILSEQYRRLGGYAFLDRAKGILDGLALSSLDLSRTVDTFSGGEKRKLSLAAVLLAGVDLLLLDEPTNNLDLVALLWLEEYLILSGATILVASHDRAFLDRVVSRVIAVDPIRHTIELYNGNYSIYAETRAHTFRRKKELYRAQEEERTRVITSVDEKMQWVEQTKKRRAPDGDKLASNYKKERAIRKFTGSAKALEGRLDRLKEHEKPFERAPLTFEIGMGAKIAPPAVSLIRVSAGYTKQSPIMKGVTLRIPFGSRIALLGENGSGKSTLLKTMMGLLEPLVGKVQQGKGALFGDLMQEQENLPRDQNAFQYFAKRFRLFERERVLLLLSQFGFVPDEADVLIGRLSPGERVRLILASLVHQGANVLVLDEPTNHLDLEAIEALEDTLAAYTGTVILISHDRTFLTRVKLDAYYLIADGRLTPIADYAAYAKRLEREAKRRLKRLAERLGK